MKACSILGSILGSRIHAHFYMYSIVRHIFSWRELTLRCSANKGPAGSAPEISHLHIRQPLSRGFRTAKTYGG